MRYSGDLRGLSGQCREKLQEADTGPHITPALSVFCSLIRHSQRRGPWVTGSPTFPRDIDVPGRYRRQNIENKMFAHKRTGITSHIHNMKNINRSCEQRGKIITWPTSSPSMGYGEAKNFFDGYIIYILTYGECKLSHGL